MVDPKRTRLLVVAFMASAGGLLAVARALLSPMLRSVVGCDRPQPLTPASASNWTGSRHCDDRELVIQEGQRLDGWLAASKLTADFVSKPFATAWADRQSRTAVLGFSVVITSIGYLMLAGAAAAAADAAPPATTQFVAPTSLIFTSSILLGLRTVTSIVNSCNTRAPFDSALRTPAVLFLQRYHARVPFLLYADVPSFSDARRRGNDFIVLLALQGGAVFAGISVAYVILSRNLDDYTWPYVM